MNIFADEILLKNYTYFLEENFIISKTDENGIITEANNKFCELSGYSKDELIGKPHNILRHPEVPSNVYKELWDTIKAGKAYSGVIKNLSKNGNTYIVEIKIFPLVDEHANLHYLSISTDITQYSLLKEQEILNASEKLKIIINSDSLIINFNQKAQEVFKFLEVNKTLDELFAFEDEEYKRKVDYKHLLYTINNILIDMLFNDKSETLEIVKYRDKAFLLEISQLSMEFILSFKDITHIENLKQAHNKNLEESKDKMLVMFTHELKTPLNGIIGFSEILSKRLNRGLERGVKERDITKYIELCDDINALGNILYGSVVSLLDSAKLKDGKYEINKSKFILSEHLNGFLELYSRIYNNTPVCDFEEFELYTDKQSIEHIFINLYSNALKYGKNEVYISLKKLDNKFELRIEDDGDGIKDSDIERIFNMFDQLDDQELTRDAKGTGIGLYLVKQLCNVLEYDISIEKSEKLGGACFVVCGDV